MKIIDKNNNYCEVVGFYRISNEDYFYVLHKRYISLIAYKKNEVKVIDPIFYGRWVYYKNGIFHWALIEYKLLDDVVDGDKDACNRFLEILISEGHIPSDAYKIKE